MLAGERNRRKEAAAVAAYPFALLLAGPSARLDSVLLLPTLVPAAQGFGSAKAREQRIQRSGEKGGR